MFSTAQNEVIQSLVPAMRRQGYKSYIAYTHTNTNYGYNRPSEPDLYILFSDEEIKALSGYTYELNGNVKLYEIRTGNYSTSNNAVNTDRIVTSDYTLDTIHIDSYEHIYTNAEFEGVTVQPDVLYQAKGGYGFEVSICSVLTTSILLFVMCFRFVLHIRSK